MNTSPNKIPYPHKTYKTIILLSILISLIKPIVSSNNDEWYEDKYTIQYKRNTITKPKQQTSSKYELSKKLASHFPWLKTKFSSDEDSSGGSASSTLFSSRRQTLFHVASYHHQNANTCPNYDSKNKHKTKKEEKSFENYFPKMSNEQKERNLSTLKSMFTHGYDSYIRLAFPSSELKPITCIKGKFDLARIPCLTLIDTLDTLLILGNTTEFAHAVELLRDYHLFKSNGIFDLDENVSLFETNIRVLGGLLSAHQLIVYIQDVKKQQIFYDNEMWIYDGFLLTLAKDIGDRFLPAFESDTGIPYGTVNLKYGVPIGETTVASLAGGGTLSIEMELLSRLTNDRRYGDAAILATRALFLNKNKQTSLVGKHININTGSWTESLSGIGSNSDSFYEYLLKFYALFNAQDFYAMFVELYMAIQTFLKSEDDHWYSDGDMNYGSSSKSIIESLSAFWPGMQVMLGDLNSAKKMLNAFYMVREEWGFLPERFDFGNWKLDGVYDAGGRYPLRPELFESTYFMYRASNSDSWLWAADFAIHALEHLTKTECGYATIRTASSRVDFNKTGNGWNGYFNLTNIELEDEMPSYFLAETIKYLYLMFDNDNVLHDENDIQWVFTTEAHPVHYIANPNKPKDKWTAKTTSKKYWEQIKHIERKLQKAKEASNAQQCCVNNHHPSLAWKHALAFDGGLEYEVGYGAKLHSTRVDEQLPVQDGLCRVNIKEEPPKPNKKSNTVYINSEQFQKHMQQEKPKTLKTTLSDNSIVEITTTSNGFYAKNDNTNESIEAAIIETTFSNDKFEPSLVLVITVQKVDDASHWTVLVADWNNNVYRCRVEMDIGGKLFTYPCSTAMFGATEMSKLISRPSINVSGEVMLPLDPNNSYGCTEPTHPVDTDKIVLVKRGECSFEQKIRNFSSAKAVLVLNNEPNHLFVMSSSSASEEMRDFETLSVLITEEDGKALMEAWNTVRIYGTTVPPEFSSDGGLEEMQRQGGSKIVATVIVEKQTSHTNDSSGETSIPNKLGTENEAKNEKWPLISTAPNLLHVLVQNNWGVQAYLQNNDKKEDEWNLFILQHDGMESNN